MFSIYHRSKGVTIEKDYLGHPLRVREKRTESFLQAECQMGKSARNVPLSSTSLPASIREGIMHWKRAMRKENGLKPVKDP